MSKENKNIQSLLSDDKVRSMVKNTLLELIKNEELVNKVAEELYKNKDTMVRNLTKLIVFANPQHYIGQFANIFREKLLGNVYTPKRIVEIEITEILPEIFLNSKGTDYTKLDIFQNINKLLEEEGENLVANWKNLLDPSKSIPTKPAVLPLNLGKTKKLIEKTFQETRDMCSNENWNIKSVNMIICKEDGNFYCLDIEKLIGELAEKNTATNYITGKALDAEIVNNIRNRYEKQISELKSGKKVDLGNWSEKDLTVLRRILKGLKEIKKADGDENKIKEILATLPPINKEKLNDKTIQEIEEILQGKEEASKPVETGEELLEGIVVRNEILKSGTLAKKLFDSYITQLENMQEIISKNIYNITDVTVRGEFQAKLNDVTALLYEIKDTMSTFDGVIKRLEEELKLQKDILKGFNAAIGMNMVFAPEKLVAQQEALAIQKYVEKLEQELEYVKKAKSTFLKKL